MTAHGTSAQPAAAAPSRKWSVRGRLGGAACVLALASGLIAAQAQGSLSTDRAPHTSQQAPPQGPPPVRLSNSALTLALHPYTSCWSSGQVGMCYDGIPPRPLPSVGGTAGSVTLAFAADNWRFRVSVTDRNGDRSRVDLVRTSPHHWRLGLNALDDGHYRADVFGRGPQGDVASAFAFTLK